LISGNSASAESDIGSFLVEAKALLPAEHLSYDEVVRILELVQDADAIVVGGQSLAIWSRHYQESKPELAAVYSMTSKDVDFYGNREAAERFARNLEQATVYLPGPDDITPHAAVVVGSIGKRKIQIDFLHSILGVSHRSIENNFITLTGTHVKTGNRIDIVVLHPLDCLRSRLSNINDLRRSDPHSISSARASIIVLDAFIDDLLQNELTREAQDTLHDLYFVVRDSCFAKPAFHKFELDPRPILTRYLNDHRLDERWRGFNLASAIRRLTEREQKLSPKLAVI
jgi:hypothetical protein